MQKIILLIATALLLSYLPATAQKKSKKSKGTDKIVGHWKHSHEDDKDSAKVYRPADYDFPPSRGREELEFKKNGEFIRHSIAPTDGLTEQKGKWKKNGKVQYVIAFEDKKIQPLIISVLSVDKTMLKIKK